MTGDGSRLAEFVHEVGALKRLPRTGWLLLGVRTPESVADHSFRTALIAMVLAVMEDARWDRAAVLGLVHDLHETRLTDTPHVTRPYLPVRDKAGATLDQTAGLPAPLSDLVNSVVAEYEDGTAPEAKCARDADKLDCLAQAIEYREQGYANVQPWIDSSLNGLQTRAAKAVAGDLLSHGSFDWLLRVYRRLQGAEPGERR